MQHGMGFFYPATLILMDTLLLLPSFFPHLMPLAELSMADLEYYVHWSRHLLASIRQATGAEALIGALAASAVTYNPNFISFLSPFVCDQSLGALSQWPDGSASASSL